MAKGNQASFAKRQREAAKRMKQAEKRLKKAARRADEAAVAEGADQPPAPEGAVEAAEGETATSGGASGA